MKRDETERVGNKYKEGGRMRHHSPLICFYHLPSYTVSHPTILQSWHSLPWHSFFYACLQYRLVWALLLWTR